MKEKTDSISGYWPKLEIESSHYGEFNDYGRNHGDDFQEVDLIHGMSLDDYYIENWFEELNPSELTKYDILR